MLTMTQAQPNPTAKERRILASMAEGHSNAETAAATGLTVRAVSAIQQRLRDSYAPTNCALIALALRLEWIRIRVWVTSRG